MWPIAAPYPPILVPPKHPSSYTPDPNVTRARPALAAQEFVKTHKNVLANYRLTGTASTMKMLRSVMPPNVVFGPTCASGPLGGDAQVHSMRAQMLCTHTFIWGDILVYFNRVIHECNLAHRWGRRWCWRTWAASSSSPTRSRRTRTRRTSRRCCAWLT